jgi:catechol 2,3-dioxygenase-like lactoylglutathione lyase family enzyme
MEGLISNLVYRFERGLLTRRELVRGLSMLTAAGSAVTVAQAQDAAIKGVKIDHVSIQVTDLPRAIAFYQKMFGFTIVSEDKPNEIVRLGGAGKVLVSLHHKSPTGLVDHFAIGVEKFDSEAVTRELKQLGANPENNLDAGFHIKDPEGLSVQIVGA